MAESPVNDQHITQQNLLACAREPLEALFGSRAAAHLTQCGGDLGRLLQSAQHQRGKSWAALRAANTLHELAILQVQLRGNPLRPQDLKDFLLRRYALAPYETFLVIFLDNRHRMLAVKELFRGTIDGARVHPREVVRDALAANAAAVALVHNHPSGVCEPSAADELITKRLINALALVDIRVLDHLIVAAGGCLSFAERGLL
jgi:DNA repair protein RadC